MPTYLISFQQSWVPDHPLEWFLERGDLARAVVEDMRAAGVLVFAGGVDEDLSKAIAAEPVEGGGAVLRDGPVAPGEPYVGGLTIVDVADEEAARYWAGRVAESCGWPQEARPFGEGSLRA